MRPIAAARAAVGWDMFAFLERKLIPALGSLRSRRMAAKATDRLHDRHLSWTGDVMIANAIFSL